MLNRSSLLSFTVILLLFSNGASAGTDVLTNNWISCSDNSSIRSASGSIQLRAECLYQEVETQIGAQLNLLCDVRTESFTSAQLSYSNDNFTVLGSSVESTSTSSTLQVNAGTAPNNTRYAVATIFADQQATLNCTLSEPDLIPESSPEPVTESIGTEPIGSSGECIDSDNDGYGWNGVASCTPNDLPSDDSATTTTSNTVPCIDSDNDGYGWNGVASCTVSDGEASTATDTSTEVATNTTLDINTLTDLILVTGQSNAQGASTNVSLAVLDAPNSRVFAFTDEDGWQVADLRQHWDGPNEPRHPGNNALIFSANTPHNNFAFHFAKSLVAIDPSRVVGFVLATSPGAGIRMWDRGSSFYNTMSNKAMAALNASNKISFDGVLWHQGETDFLYNGTSDILTPSSERFSANYYPERLYALIRNLRQEPWFSGDKAVFVCGETQTTNQVPTEIAPVNRRLMAINNDSDRYTGCVSADGLQTTDGIHFNAASLRELGRRYAVKYYQLKNQ